MIEKFGTHPKAILAYLLILVYASGMPAMAAESRSFPMGLAYPGCIKPNNVDQAAMNKTVLDYWTNYKSKYIKPSGSGGGYYVEMRTTNAGSTDKSSSEATGYGMVFSALMAGTGGDPDSRKYFDGFFAMFDKNRSGTNNALMSYTVGQAENSHSNSATDGDMDIAYALLLAHYQWGSTGAVNYLKESKRIITEGIKKSEMGAASHRTLLGDWDKNGWNTRSSDWMADHMMVFQKATGDSFWGDARKTVFALIGQITSTRSGATGLMPDFAVGDPPKPADPNFLEAQTDGDYSWNACRYPLRLAVDYAHYGSPESKSALAKVSQWIIGATGGNPMAIKAGYHLDGAALVVYSDMSFTAPLIASAIVDPSRQDFLNKGWAYMGSTKQGSYYGDSIELLAMLLISGNWWAPDDRAVTPVMREPRGRAGAQGNPSIRPAAKRLNGGGRAGSISLDGRRAEPARVLAEGEYLIGYP